MKNEYAGMTCERFADILSKDHDGRYEIVLEYDCFQVVFDNEAKRFFYMECTDDDESYFFELYLVASLAYDIHHQPLRSPQGHPYDVLHSLFDCDICGETVMEDHIEYVWFARKEA